MFEFEFEFEFEIEIEIEIEIEFEFEFEFEIEFAPSSVQMYWGLSVQWVKMAELTESLTKAGESSQSPRRSNVRSVFLFYLVRFYLMFSGNMGKDV